jgi:glycine cleavage system aminomethyltransferase T
MTADDDSLIALRTGVVKHRRRPAIAWVRGEHAFETVEGLCPRDLFIRSGQILHSLVLDESGGVEAELCVCSRGDDYLLLADGLDDAGLLARLRAHTPRDADVQIEPLAASEYLLGVSGPYAWELIAALFGPELTTVRYLSSVVLPELGHAGRDALCLRLGTTGEYCYELLLPAATAAALEAKLDVLGQRFDLREVDVATLDRAALENGFFCPRHRGVLGRSPLELQLQWRLTYDLEFRGSAALRAARAQGPTPRRLTWVLGQLDDDPPSSGPLTRGEQDAIVGELLDGFVSPMLGCFVGIALIDRPLAHPWIRGFRDTHDRELQTEAPPLLQNRSLFVDPKRHSYRFRADDCSEFPPIVPGVAP